MELCQIEQALNEVMDEVLAWPPEWLNPISRQIVEEERARRLVSGGSND